jgi:phospholipid/cholesterol/gamma-HCH transport system substrate-binding protein
MARRTSEIAAGAVVLVVAAAFLAYAGTHTGEGGGRGYDLTADFNRIDGLTAGSDVRLAGVRVGRVVSASINPQTYQAHVVLTVKNDIHLPTDSSAEVANEGLLGGMYLQLSPGGSEQMLKPGGRITITQSAVNLEDLLGKFIFNVGDLASAVQKTLPKSDNGNAPKGDLP